MKPPILDSASYAATTMSFFLFVGGFIGTLLTLPFVQMLTHRPFRVPESLFMLLLGYLVVGMPVAALTGLLYGICSAFFQRDSVGRALSAIGCGIVPSVLFMTIFNIWNPKESRNSLIVVCCLMLFTGFASLVTAWVHWQAELRFEFLRANGK